MILPSKPLLAALSVWLTSGIATAFSASFSSLWIWGGLLLLLWVAGDFLLVHRQALPFVQRVAQSTLALGEWSPIEIRLHWPGSVPAQAWVFDHYPTHFAHEGLPGKILTHNKNSFALHYRVRPLLRGNHAFACIELRAASPWRAWLRQTRHGEPQEVRVYPNFAPLARHALRAVDYRNARFGLQHRRRRGQGLDFAQLREYREGDSMRQIDWKATTRMGKMISREYQDERDHRIILLIDCGRSMGARDGDLSHFDHALDTVLMLAYVALSHGDRVGMMTLGGPDRYLPVQHSASTVSHILREIYDLQPSLQVSDFERAAQQLMARDRKRALVVLFTNLRDEDDQGLVTATRLLGKRHLVLVASLRESALDRVQAEAVCTSNDAATLSAAVAYARRREATFRRLRAEGILCLDTAPDELAIETVNRYLADKAASLL